jgi:hypothetical protein
MVVDMNREGCGMKRSYPFRVVLLSQHLPAIIEENQENDGKCKEVLEPGI